MKLAKLISFIDCKVIGQKHREITHLTHLAQDCTSGSAFFCLNGKSVSGQAWLQTAIDNGCRVIVGEQSITTNKKVTQIIVSDARKAMSQIASVFYGEPAKKLKIIGVTGTNGKTTTTHIISHILKSQFKVGLIGTNGVFYGQKCYQTGFTTPDPILLQKVLSDMLKSGVEYVVMEYSAHAIYLQKLWGIMSHVVAFTNFSQDHLDYFENMQQYFDAKAKLFDEKNYQKAVVCTDDKWGQKIAHLSKDLITCSTNNSDSNIFVKSSTHTTSSQSFELQMQNKTQKFDMSLLGSFNLQNALVAISVCLQCNMTLDQIASSLKTLKCVDGRFECYSNGTNTVIIDYAHTPDGLENVLKTTQEIAGKNRVVCVFGCGGNRDADKRAKMGKVSETWADFTIVTTDNPRNEDNFDIAQDIVKGFAKNKYKIVLDRGQALRTAIDMCRSGDVVLIAGKGAETYTEICGVKVPSSDRELVNKVLNLV